MAIELSNLISRLNAVFGIDDVSLLPDAVLECVESCDIQKYDSFLEAVEGDLSTDWMQMIWQYYFSDRKEKKQDYTPKSLSKLLSFLVGDNRKIVDLCAGSGSLSIQKWSNGSSDEFTAYELDERVIPFLLFNYAIRNIPATVNRADAIEDEIYESWKLGKGERYANIITHIKSSV